MVLDLKRVLGKLKVNGLFFYGSCVFLLIIVVVVVDDDVVVIDDDVLLKSIIKVMVPEVVDFFITLWVFIKVVCVVFQFFRRTKLN